MPVTLSKFCTYVSLLVLIGTLLYFKHKNGQEKEKEPFANAAFRVKVTSGSSVALFANSTDLLVNVPADNKKNNAMYLALIKVDGTPRIINSYSENDNALFLKDLEIYFDKAKLLSDKYIILFSKGSPYTKLSPENKDFIKNNLKAEKITDVSAAQPYILIYDPVDDNVRVELTGVNGETITYDNTLYSTKRDVAYNKDGLMVSGLQCYLDATRKESYEPSFGKVWKDISGKGRNFQWEKQPMHADGKFLHTSPVGGSAFGPNCDKFELGDGSNGYSIVICAKTNSMQYGHAFVAQGVPNFYGIQAHIPWPNEWVYFDQGWPYAGENINRVDAYVGPCSTMCIWAFVRDYDGTMKIYKDGSLIVQSQPGSTDKFPLNLKDVPWEISKNLDSNMSKFMIYNTFLTQEDVTGVTKWIQADEAKQGDIRMKEQEKNVPDTIPVRLGLQLFLDTNNYAAGSKEWKDQSGNGYDFTWNSPPKVESKSFLLNGEYALSNKGSRLLNIDTRDNYTICWIAKTNSLSVNSVFKIKGNHSNKRAIFCHPTWVNNFIYFDQAGCCDDNSQRVYASVDKYSNDYAFYCLRKTGNERAIFINGTKIAARPGGAPINVNLEQMIIGRDLEDGYTWFANLRSFMVYNRDLTESEMNKLYAKFFSRYEFGRYTYDAADLFCRKQGKKLCKTGDYCANGKPSYTMDEEDKWAPIGDYPDGWIQLGKNGDTCKSFKQKCQFKKDSSCGPNDDPTWSNKADREVAILCCDTKYQPLIINAIYMEGSDPNVHRNKLTFFRDKFYQSIRPDDVSKVDSIKKFKGLTTHFANGNIDAIVQRDAKTSIWFRDKYVMVYDGVKQVGTETTMKEYFNKLPDDFNDGFIDAVASLGFGRQYVFFKKTRYCMVDMTTNTMVSNGFIAEKYKAMPKEFTLGFFDCAMWSGGSTSYIMKNDKLIQFDFSNNTMVKGPIQLTSVWGTLLPPFTPRQSVCGVYEKIMNMYKDADERKAYWKAKYYNECKRIAKTEYETNIENYKKLVTKYKTEYNKEHTDRKKIEMELAAYQKKLKEKMNEWKKMEQNYLDIKMKPCKKDDVCSDKKVKVPTCKTPPLIPKKHDTKKQVIIHEIDKNKVEQKFYEMNSANMENCYYDPNVGSKFKDGFNFFKHPKSNEYVDATKVKTIRDFDIKDYPEYGKYIEKSKIPKQRSASDFKIEEHPDYIKYSKKKGVDMNAVASLPQSSDASSESMPSSTSTATATAPVKK